MSNQRLNVLIAPNSLKGSMSAFEFADIMKDAFMKVSPEFSIRKVSVADGGDFTGEVLRVALKAKIIEVTVSDPLGRPVSSRFAVAGTTAVIEMADATGIRHLKPNELNPMNTSSLGTGQLIAAAIEKGCTEILLGVGGSATIDGGTGMIQALGFKFLDADGNEIEGNGKNLPEIHTIIKPESLPQVSVKVISDVNNPLLGPEGAAAVFGPQKGATPGQVELLEEGLASWCRLLEDKCGRNLSQLQGTGAAGALALPLLAFFDAELVPGAEFILSALNFDEHVQWADIVITGEGKIDSQTLNNKAPKAVADSASRWGKPVIAVGGSVESMASDPFSAGAFSFLPGPVTLDDAIKNASFYLDSFSTQLAKNLLLFLKK